MVPFRSADTGGGIYPTRAVNGNHPVLIPARNFASATEHKIAGALRRLERYWRRNAAPVKRLSRRGVNRLTKPEGRCGSRKFRR